MATGAARGAGSLSGSRAAAGEGSAAGYSLAGSAGSIFAAEGSGAANGNGAFAIAPGMDVLSQGGTKIGEVREIVADGNGQVRQLLVANGDGRQLIPAGNFTTAGDVLVMGNGQASGETSRDDGDPTPERGDDTAR